MVVGGRRVAALLLSRETRREGGWVEVEVGSLLLLDSARRLVNGAVGVGGS